MCNNDLAAPVERPGEEYDIFGSDNVEGEDPPGTFEGDPEGEDATDDIFGLNDPFDNGGEEPRSNTEIEMLGPGLTCANNLECRLFSDCSQDKGLCQLGTTDVDVFDLRDTEEFINLRSNEGACPRGQMLCCNPVPGDLFETRIGIITEDDPLGDGDIDVERTIEICEDPQLRATINYGFGLTCGKRDSRVYYDAIKSETEGGQGDASNPGEWPWALLIFRNDDASGEKYVGAGTMMDNNVVVTTATKVKDFIRDPSNLSIRLGDWDPKSVGPNSREEFPHITKRVSCIKIHPKFDDKSLVYNIAVIKLKEETNQGIQTPEEKSVASIVGIRSGPKRPANRPEGVEGFNKNLGGDQSVGLRQGVRRSLEEEAELRKQLLEELNNEVGSEATDLLVPRSYINTVCLPENTRQFLGGHDCWVAAWSNNLREQREVKLPLVGRSDCDALLKPEFVRRGVRSWSGIDASELCAGGQGMDACEGEGGAPLVCLDKELDQYFAVGLVNYGFDCTGKLPAVYVNLAAPDIKSFITQAFEDENYC